ncbi:carbohydrate ABC transporter permease [Arthrobacter castelli]|uniref:carbohydrate ABC transporter permease n=1 Tax=Arthrobacter castelli TaxID=271431 RepID=UPI000407CE56
MYALTLRTRRSVGRWSNMTGGLILLAVLLFPVYWMVNLSLSPGGSTLTSELFPADPSLQGYKTAIADQGGNLVTSLLVALGSVALSLAVATPAAYAIAQFRLKGARILLLAVVVGQMIPGIVLANALYDAFNKLGLLNSILGLILANATAGVPFAVLIISAFMQAVPPGIIEAARVDGAGHVRAFLSVVLPVSTNALVTAGIFSFLFAWSDFLFALTLTTTERVRPITLGIYQYIGTQVTNWNSVMATAVLASIPAVILLVSAQKFIAAGATGGAIK